METLSHHKMKKLDFQVKKLKSTYGRAKLNGNKLFIKKVQNT
jgi:hypothetical protein